MQKDWISGMGWTKMSEKEQSFEVGFLRFEECSLIGRNQIPEHIMDVAVAALHDNQLLLIQIQLSKGMVHPIHLKHCIS